MKLKVYQTFSEILQSDSLLEIPSSALWASEEDEFKMPALDLYWLYSLFPEFEQLGLRRIAIHGSTTVPVLRKVFRKPFPPR